MKRATAIMWDITPDDIWDRVEKYPLKEMAKIIGTPYEKIADMDEDGLFEAVNDYFTLNEDKALELCNLPEEVIIPEEILEQASENGASGSEEYCDYISYWLSETYHCCEAGFVIEDYEAEQLIRVAISLGVSLSEEKAEEIMNEYEPLLTKEWTDDDYRSVILSALDIANGGTLNVKIESLDTELSIQYGDDNLTDEDYDNGYDRYVDYDILQGINKGDGGILMLEESRSDDLEEVIPEVIKFALSIDYCPEYTLAIA